MLLELRHQSARPIWGVLLLTLTVSCGSPDEGDETQATGGMGGTDGMGTGGGGPGEGGMGGDSPQVLACDFGDDTDKCEGRADLVCTPAGSPTGVDCSRDDDCQNGELCFEKQDGDATSGACLALFGTCTALCGGDFDCPSDEHCDPKSGECVDAAPAGASFGEECESAEDCRGLCVEVSEDTFECEEHCRVGATSGCGKEELSGSGVACAFFAYDLSDADLTQGEGDVGICAQLCTCNDDCPGAQLCLDQPTDGHAGVCAGGVDEEQSLPCDAGLGGAPNQ